MFNMHIIVKTEVLNLYTVPIRIIYIGRWIIIIVKRCHALRVSGHYTKFLFALYDLFVPFFSFITASVFLYHDMIKMYPLHTILQNQLSWKVHRVFIQWLGAWVWPRQRAQTVYNMLYLSNFSPTNAELHTLFIIFNGSIVGH